MLSLAIITWWSWSTSVQRHREKDIDVSSMRCGACMLPVWNQVPVIGEPHVDIPLEHIRLEGLARNSRTEKRDRCFFTAED